MLGSGVSRVPLINAAVDEEVGGDYAPYAPAVQGTSADVVEADAADERKARPALVPRFYELRPSAAELAEPRDEWLAPADHHLFLEPRFPPLIKIPSCWVIVSVGVFFWAVILVCAEWGWALADLFDEPDSASAIRRLLGLLFIPVCSVAFTYGHI